MHGGGAHSPARAGPPWPPPLLPVCHLQTRNPPLPQKPRWDTFPCSLSSPGLLLGFREPVCHHHCRLPVNSVYFPRELGSHGPPAGAFRVCDEKHGCRITVCFLEEKPPRDGFEPAAGCMIFSLCKQLCCFCEGRAADGLEQVDECPAEEGGRRGGDGGGAGCRREALQLSAGRRRGQAASRLSSRRH